MPNYLAEIVRVIGISRTSASQYTICEHKSEQHDVCFRRLEVGLLSLISEISLKTTLTKTNSTYFFLISPNLTYARKKELEFQP